MIRKIKRLGLAFIAIMAMNVAASSAAQASELHAEGGPSVNITGQQTTQQKIQIFPSLNIQCTTASFEGTVQGDTQSQTTAQEFTLTPTYTGCTLGGLNAIIDMNGCKYTVTGNGQPALTALVDISGCTSGKTIEITAPGCTITVPEQPGLSHVTFTNIPGPPKDLEVQFTIASIKYEVHGFTCGTPETQLRQDGQYVGKATFRAFVDSGSEQATHNGHQYNKLKCGNQLGLFAT
jgi:hypothetical protein